jgi:hypothetical protein
MHLDAIAGVSMAMYRPTFNRHFGAGNSGRDVHQLNTPLPERLLGGSSMRRSRLLLAASVVFWLSACSPSPEAAFVTSVPWGLTGSHVVLDGHSHTRFSDGALSPQELATEALLNGCGALAITDHGDLSVRAATPEYFAAIDEARKQHPGLILLAGMEWNVPPYGGREHVTMLLDPALEQVVLPGFKARFEQKEARPEEALAWLVQQTQSTDRVVLIYNHPSRRDLDAEENFSDFLKWNADQALFVGFEGAPGHQRAPSPGDYGKNFPTEGRWDPVVAKIGGTWDRLLDAGKSVWGAVAVSDYHAERLDFPPCSFARTHLRVPQRDHQGVLLALRAGSFWAGHGDVLEDLTFIAVASGLPVPATPGEAVRLSSAVRPIFRVKVKRSRNADAMPLTVELIGNGRSGTPELVAMRELSPAEETFDWQPDRLVPGADGRSAYFRESDCQGIARGRPRCLQQSHQASAREIRDVSTRLANLAVAGLHSWPRN